MINMIALKSYDDKMHVSNFKDREKAFEKAQELIDTGQGLQVILLCDSEIIFNENSF